jgi:hypothetical protein
MSTSPSIAVEVFVIVSPSVTTIVLIVLVDVLSFSLTSIVKTTSLLSFFAQHYFLQSGEQA